MSRFGLFVLFLLHALQLVASKSCPSDELIPGIEQLARGVDITQFELFPRSLPEKETLLPKLLSKLFPLLNPTNHIGFRAPVIEFSCNTKQIWNDPVEDVMFRRPDQFASVKLSDFVEHNHVFYNMDDYKKAAGERLGLSELPDGAFSQTTGVGTMQQKLFNSSMIYAEISATPPAIEASFKPSSELRRSDMLLRYLNENCTQLYEASPEVYQNFIKLFGTHYFESATLGGHVFTHLPLDDSYLIGKRHEDVAAELNSLTVSGFKAGGGGGGKSAKNFTGNFNHGNNDMFLYGGLTSAFLADSNQTTGLGDQWADTVFRDPWLIGGKLRPITELIKNKTVKAQVEKAVKIHCAIAYLGEVNKTLEISGVELSKEEMELLNKTEVKLKSNETLDVTEVLSGVHSIVDKVQLARDKHFLSLAIEPIGRVKDQILDCKSELFTSLSRRCKLNPSIGFEIKKNFETATKLVQAIGELNQQQNQTITEIRSLTEEARAFIADQQNTVVPFCGNTFEHHNHCQFCIRKGLENLKLDKCRTEEFARVVDFQQV